MPKVDRRITRNIARAIAGRTFNETRMKQQVFYQGIKFGVDMAKSRLFSSTAHLTYTEEITNVEAPVTNLAGPDDAPNGVPAGGETSAAVDLTDPDITGADVT